ncbi:hypothetical protein GY45DRAFT_166093 [Cubamyces sp. BRFM 1775]|nr:hypothetical protein GY45DRAFT_166093 [Cubamyces sp. BRFM 1775]
MVEVLLADGRTGGLSSSGPAGHNSSYWCTLRHERRAHDALSLSSLGLLLLLYYYYVVHVYVHVCMFAGSRLRSRTYHMFYVSSTTASSSSPSSSHMSLIAPPCTHALETRPLLLSYIPFVLCSCFCF